MLHAMIARLRPSGSFFRSSSTHGAAAPFMAASASVGSVLVSLSVIELSAAPRNIIMSDTTPLRLAHKSHSKCTLAE